MLQHLTELTIQKVCSLCGSSDELRQYISGLTECEQAELLALMWQGRNDAIDGRIPFAEQLIHAKDTVNEGTANYISEKSSVLRGYLQNGLRLIKAEANGQL